MEYQKEYDIKKTKIINVNEDANVNEVIHVNEIKREISSSSSKFVDTVQNIQFENVVIKMEKGDQFLEETVEESFDKPLINQDEIKNVFNQNDINFKTSAIQNENKNQDFVNHLHKRFDNSKSLETKADENYADKSFEDPLENVNAIKIENVENDMELVNGETNIEGFSEDHIIPFEYEDKINKVLDKNYGENIRLVPEYESDRDRSDNEASVAKKTKMCLDWNLVQKFDNCEEAETAVKTEGTWSLHYRHKTEDGKKRYYRCNKLKRRGPQCSSRMYLLFDNTSNSVLMFKTNADHDHDEKNEFTSLYGLSDTVKTEINKLFDLKMKPKAIMQSLTKMENIRVPKMSQLRNYLSDRRRAIYGQPTISLGELEVWIHSHTDLPFDPHEVFVICYQIDDSYETNPIFRLIMSTKYLIEISKDASVVHIDVTHKIIWQGFPVLVCGTTDQNQKFHPLCLAVSSNEQKEDFKFMFEGLQKKIQEIFESSWNPKVLVCDTAKGIQNAFLEVFGENVVVRMCWAYAKRKIQERIERIKNKELRNVILNDVDTLHSITDKNIFDAAAEAFLQKFKDQIEFVTYFKAQWLAQNCNWFLGVAPNSPSTNNALESFNKVIKDSNNLREHLPLSKFLVVAKEMVSQWSNKYITNPEDNYVAIITSLTTKDWTDAYQWAKIPKEVPVVYKDDKYNYYQIPAGQATNCEIFDAQWESFDDFKKQNFSKWLVLLPIEKNEWRKGRCNCPAFFNFYKCKHVIGLAIRLKYTVPPPEAKTIPIGKKRKRGQPSKGKQALIIH